MLYLPKGESGGGLGGGVLKGGVSTAGLLIGIPFLFNVVSDK